MDETINILSKLEPGRLPFDVFHQIARVVVIPSVALVPYCVENGSISVLLTRRSESDPYYPLMLHPPGVVLLPTDLTINDALQRLMMTELHDVGFVGEPIFIDYFFDDIVRGKELTLVFAVQIALRPSDEFMFRIDGLPENLLPTDLLRIERVAEVLSIQGGL